VTGAPSKVKAHLAHDLSYRLGGHGALQKIPKAVLSGFTRSTLVRKTSRALLLKNALARCNVVRT
jgi:hypothetical protein